MAAYLTVLNYVYSLCVFYYSVLSCVADVADCPLLLLFDFSITAFLRHTVCYRKTETELTVLTKSNTRARRSLIMTIIMAMER